MSDLETENDSPYKAPQAHTLAKDIEPYTPHAFSTHGRIGRARYICYSLWLSMLVMFVGAMIGGFVLAALSSHDTGTMKGYAVIVGLGLYVPVFGIFLVMAKRRLNDLGFSGWWGLMIFLPFINMLLALCLLFWPANDHANKYGPPPAENSLPVIIFGIVVPVALMVLALLAVLLPALIGFTFSLQPGLFDGL